MQVLPPLLHLLLHPRCSFTCSCINPSEEGPVAREYRQLEVVGPAPGDPWGQHDAMVGNRLNGYACL